MTNHESTAISGAAKLLGRYGIEAGFLVPTGTALDKGIMDATWPLREYLARTGFHDYRTQGQGGSSKRVVPVVIVQSSAVVASEASLYRPETKQGDPRIWIYGLPKSASPDDLLALIVDGGQLYIVNCTREDLPTLLADPASPLGKMAARLDTHAGAAAALLEKLQSVGAKGFVPVVVRSKGDSSVRSKAD